MLIKVPQTKRNSKDNTVNKTKAVAFMPFCLKEGRISDPNRRKVKWWLMISMCVVQSRFPKLVTLSYIPTISLYLLHFRI